MIVLIFPILLFSVRINVSKDRRMNVVEPVFKLDIRMNQKMYEDLNYAVNKMIYGVFYLLLRIIGLTFIGILILQGIAGLDSDYFVEPSLMYLSAANMIIMILLCVGIVFITSTRQAARRGARRSIRYSRDPFQKIHYEFYPDYFVVQTEFMKSELKYLMITQAVISGDTICLFTSKVQAYVIPKDYFSETGLIKLKAFIEETARIPFKEVN